MSPERKYYLQVFHCRNKTDANGNPVEMRMTFDEWYSFWQDSGHWEERGRKKGQYCMCRLNDLGHYEIGNVYIAKCEENVRDYNESGRRGQSKESLSDARSKHNYDTMMRMRRYRDRLKAKHLATHEV
jgi:hypothetical protein